jgi:hypothetical protein
MVNETTEQHLAILKILAGMQNMAMPDNVDFLSRDKRSMGMQVDNRQKHFVAVNRPCCLLASPPRLHELLFDWFQVKLL